MRIERILSHWNVVGFRQLAIEFVKFLEKEIYGPHGYKAFLKQMVILSWFSLSAHKYAFFLKKVDDQG